MLKTDLTPAQVALLPKIEDKPGRFGAILGRFEFRSVRDAMCQALQWGLGNILTAAPTLAQHNNSEIRAQKRRNINKLAQSAGLFFAFSVWDEVFENYNLNEFLGHLNPNTAQRFRAYRHLRHSAAHFYTGKRAKLNQDDCSAFDAIMAGPDPFPNVLWCADTIDISASTVGVNAVQFMHQTMHTLAQEIANPG